MTSSARSSPFWQAAARRAADRHGGGLLDRGARQVERQQQQQQRAEVASLLERFRSVTRYSPAQRHIFFDSAALGRFRIFPKGRRLGATRGAAHAFIEAMLQGWPCLWGDTINGNIDRYVERYFIPALKRAGITFTWNAQKRLLRVGAGYTDFRSADRPENWEGFGYRLIFLNEAGIILADPYLYENAVLPTMLDHADSTLIAAGTPKGKRGKGGKEHLFYTLFKRAQAGEPGHTTRTFTSHDNPWLDLAAVDALIETYGGPETAAAQQEMLGQFLDLSDDAWQIIPRAWVQAAQDRWQRGEGAPEAGTWADQIGVDPARGGRDHTVVAQRFGEWFAPLITQPGRATPDGGHVAALVQPLLAPHTQVQIDLGAVGSSPFDILAGVHARTVGVQFGTASRATDRTGRLRMRNVRAAMYWSLREALDPANGLALALPPDEALADELGAGTWFLSPHGVQVQDKDSIKKALGRSPDRADAVVLAWWLEHTPEYLLPESHSYGVG